MSATATEKTIPWRSTPPGSLCEVYDADNRNVLQLRWPIAEAPPVVDCGLQPVVLPHDHECDVLVLWPYDPSERSRRAFAAAAVAQVRRATSLLQTYRKGYHRKLRVHFA